MKRLSSFQPPLFPFILYLNFNCFYFCVSNCHKISVYTFINHFKNLSGDRKIRSVPIFSNITPEQADSLLKVPVFLLLMK